jgi:hypothetical protein
MQGLRGLIICVVGASQGNLDRPTKALGSPRKLSLDDRPQAPAALFAAHDQINLDPSRHLLYKGLDPGYRLGRKVHPNLGNASRPS